MQISELLQKSFWNHFGPAILISTFILGNANAQYPDKALTLVIPFPPAGSTDVLGRLLAQTMSSSLGQNVIVENTGGAGGTIGAGRVARANPDGYTALFHNMAQASAPALYAKLPYDPNVDFEPVGMVANVPMILVARKDFPANGLSGLLEFDAKNPGKLNFANAGIGATSHLCEVLLKSVTSANWASIPYKGTGPALNDLLGGQVDLICDQPASTISHIKAGTLKPIAVATKERIKSLPQVPTFAESGLPKFELAVWHGLYLPKNTPKPIVERVANSLRAALKDPILVQRYTEMGAMIAPPNTVNPDYLKSFLRAYIDKWKVAMKNANIQPE